MSDDRGRGDSLIQIRGLSFKRGSRWICNSIDLDIERGKVTAIMGPSGTGKTTLLRLIGGQVEPLAGSIHVDGEEITALTRDELFVARRKMGMLFQSGALFTDLSVYENVAFPLRVHTRLPESMIRDLVLMKLQAVGLRGACDLMPSQLSGGMGRRAALARAIVLDPPLIMYDEPFAGQDPITMGMLVKLIRQFNDALAVTSVIVSHDVHETATIADFIYVMAEGRIIGAGTPKELLESDDPHVRQFIHGLPDGPVPFQYPAVDYRADLGLSSADLSGNRPRPDAAGGRSRTDTASSRSRTDKGAR